MTSQWEPPLEPPPRPPNTILRVFVMVVMVLGYFGMHDMNQWTARGCSPLEATGRALLYGGPTGLETCPTQTVSQTP